jgi:arylsulfatase A-like enzyme
MHPDRVGVQSHRDSEIEAFRERLGHLPMLPRHLRDHGYEARGFGKIHHDGWDDPADWSAPPQPGREGEMLEIANLGALKGVPYEKRADVPTLIASRHDCPAIQSPDVPDDALFAGRMTTQALKVMQADRDAPLFLAVGYRRPHLPFVAPKRYFDLYQPTPEWLPEIRRPATGAPVLGFFNSDGYVGMLKRFNLDLPNPPTTVDEALRWAGFELRSYNGMPKDGVIDDATQIRIRHAYMACISYVDAQIGRLLDELDRSDRWANTVVLLWADHGWHLGEHGAWSKMTNYEIATRIPLIVAAPGLSTAGQSTPALAELLDLYPTLCDLTGLLIPDHCDGRSLAPVLTDPAASVHELARSQYPRFKTHQGHAIRTDRYRYVEWTETKTGRVTARELYDHQTDPHESENRAQAEPDITDRLSKLITP